MDNKELVPLATAHVTQKTGSDGTKSEWSVEANITNEVLVKLDKYFTDPQVFEILDFARKYELIALNVGIDFGKELSEAHYKPIEKGLNKVIAELTEANERLSSKLESLIGEEV